MRFEPWTRAYQLLHTRIGGLLPHFNDLHMELKKSGIRISIAAYLSFMILTSTIVSLVVMGGMLFVFPLLFRFNILSSANIVVSILFGFLAFILTFMIMYVIPGIKTSNRRNPIDVNLPYILNFLTLLSSSGVPPKTIFRDMATIDTLGEVRQDFSNVMRDTEIFGQDLLTSIQENMNYMPSQGLRETLIGYVATIKTGGNPTEYLRVNTENVMREKMVKLDLMLESLSAIAEIYIMVLVAFPLLFVVMFATLGMLGGGSGGNLALMLYLLTYAFIPIVAAILILVVSTYEVK